jgi:hypothetical protein
MGVTTCEMHGKNRYLMTIANMIKLGEMRAYRASARNQAT